MRQRICRNIAFLLAIVAFGGGSAWAQTCSARVLDPPLMRAEGLMEMAGQLDIACRIPTAVQADDLFGSTIPTKLEITVMLNAPITNDTETDDREVQGLTLETANYDGSSIPTTTAGDTDAVTALGMGKLSADGRTITWEANTGATDTTPGAFNLASGTGFYLTISGIVANASDRGHGNDVTAMASVNGNPTNNTPRVVGEVLNGLMLDVDDMTAYQCQKGDEMVTLTIMEGKGFTGAITSDDPDTTPEDEADVLTVSFSGIPDGVTVMVPVMVEKDEVDAAAPTTDNEDDSYFNLALNHDSRDSSDGVSDVEAGDTMAEVIISSSGSGMASFKVSATDNGGDANDTAVKDEKTELIVTFKWDAGDVDLGTVMTAASYSPFSGRSPEYVMGSYMDALMVSNCATSLTFPFVTNRQGYDTGVALSNPSESNGSCMVTYSGMPDAEHMEDVAAGMTAAFNVSMMAMGFQGIVMAECDFLDAEGLAIITNGAGMTPSLAHGYLAVTESSGEDTN